MITRPANAGTVDTTETVYSTDTNQATPVKGRRDEAAILIGHGSLRSASGASMIRIAARLREEGRVEVVEPAFLNFSRPTFAEALGRCHEAGFRQIVVQPYFLIDGAYVRHDLPRLVAETQADFPDMQVRIAPAFGYHPALVELAHRRMEEALEAAQTGTQIEGQREAEVKLHDQSAIGLLLMAHGTPLPQANAPLYATLQELCELAAIDHGTVAYLDCNTPTVPAGVDELVKAGATTIITLPYFLHLGRHVREDLPRLLDQSAAQHPQVRQIRAQHLDYDLGLVRVIADRLTQVV